MQSTPSEVPAEPPATPADVPATPAQPPASPRGGRTMRDMATSMVVLLIPVVIVVGLFRFFGGEDVVTTDTQPAFDAARAASAFPVFEPKDLGDGWRSIRSVYGAEEGGSALRVGYVTPAGGGVQLVESNQPVEAVIRHELGESVVPTGTVDVAGRTWQSYTVRNGERALLLLEPGRTIVIVGSAGESELTELAAALH